MSEGVGQYIRENKNAANEWAGQNFVQGYIKLVPQHSEVSMEKKINEVLVKHGSEDMKALGISKILFLEPVKDIHLKSAGGQNPTHNLYLYYRVHCIVHSVPGMH